MERHGEHFRDRSAEHLAEASRFPIDGGHHNREDRLNGGHYQQHQHNFNGQQNNSNGYHLNGNHSRSASLSGTKRKYYSDGDTVKLYVAGVPRAATEQQIRTVFGELGQIVEVIFIKDKATGIQRECCFVKYATMDQAEMAMVVFNSDFTFPGAKIPMKVKFAAGERERLRSTDGNAHKLYVGSVNKEAAKWEIEKIFSPFGVIEEVYVVRDEFNQNCGYAFVQFLYKEMATAAIQALDGTYVMRGCDVPLIVRFANPRRPWMADSRPAPFRNSPSNAHAMPNKIQQMKSSDLQSTGETPISKDTPSASRASDSIAVAEPPIECDWSEHVSPDGELYYYNCETCESRWAKPEEYALYEQELDKLEVAKAQKKDSKLLPAVCVLKHNI